MPLMIKIALIGYCILSITNLIPKRYLKEGKQLSELQICVMHCINSCYLSKLLVPVTAGLLFTDYLVMLRGPSNFIQLKKIVILEGFFQETFAQTGIKTVIAKFKMGGKKDGSMGCQQQSNIPS